MANFDQNVYCNFDAVSAKAKAGKDIVICIFNDDGSKLLAIAGQKTLNISRKADVITVNTKDTKGGWKSSIQGMKEWSIDLDGMYVLSDTTHKILGKAFASGKPLCMKIVDAQAKTSLFGGLVILSDYSLDAPAEDMLSYKLTLSGTGELTDLTTLESEEAGKVTAMPTAEE